MITHLKKDDRTLCGRTCREPIYVEKDPSCQHCIRMGLPKKPLHKTKFSPKFTCDKCGKPYRDNRDKRVGDHWIRHCAPCRR